MLLLFPFLLLIRLPAPQDPAPLQPAAEQQQPTAAQQQPETAAELYARVLRHYAGAAAVHLDGTVRIRVPGAEAPARGRLVLRMVRPRTGRLRVDYEEEDGARAVEFLADGARVYLVDHAAASALDLSGDFSPLAAFLDLDPLLSWMEIEGAPPLSLERLPRGSVPGLAGLRVGRAESRQEWWLDDDGKIVAASVIPVGDAALARPRLDFVFSSTLLLGAAAAEDYRFEVPEDYLGAGGAAPR